jgi:hypothetical protein
MRKETGSGGDSGAVFFAAAIRCDTSTPASSARAPSAAISVNDEMLF